MSIASIDFMMKVQFTNVKDCKRFIIRNIIYEYEKIIEHYICMDLSLFSKLNQIEVMLHNVIRL